MQRAVSILQYTPRSAVRILEQRRRHFSSLRTPMRFEAVARPWRTPAGRAPRFADFVVRPISFPFLPSIPFEKVVFGTFRKRFWFDQRFAHTRLLANVQLFRYQDWYDISCVALCFFLVEACLNASLVVVKSRIKQCYNCQQNGAEQTTQQ